MSDEKLDKLILLLLDEVHPSEESRLMRHLAVTVGADPGQVKTSLNHLHSENKIRWVAFRGWCLGGRP